MHLRFSLGTKFQLKLTIVIFWTKFTQKEYFCRKTEKVNNTIEFWNQKVYFQFKMEKGSITFEFCIFRFFQIARYHYYFDEPSPEGPRDN